MEKELDNTPPFYVIKRIGNGPGGNRPSIKSKPRFEKDKDFYSKYLLKGGFKTKEEAKEWINNNKNLWK